jgi:cysteine desulfurase
MRPVTAIGRLPPRLAEEAGQESPIKRLKERSLVKQPVSTPELRVARDLSAAKGEVGTAAHREPRHVERPHDASQDETKAPGDVAEPGAAVEGQHEREAEAPRTQQDTPASRGPVEHGNPGRLARLGMNLVVEPSRAAEDHDRARVFPEPQDLEPTRVASGPSRVLERAQQALVESQVGPGIRQREVDEIHGQKRADHTTPVYLDCAATTPIDPRVRDVVLRYLDEEFGNAGSRTHDFGHRARRAVERARDQVAAVVEARRGEVIFTSGATESNNLALLGLAEHGGATGRRHVVSTAIEHHAVLGPLAELQRRGFAVTLVAPRSDGAVEPEAVRAALRADTLLVSIMHANNETGALQPVAEIAEALADTPAFFHVDAAQGFGKDLETLRHPRIDLISASAHKIHGPKGVGALILRRRGEKRPPLAPLLHGGGQELGLRPGTLPVALVAGLGEAAELALAEAAQRAAVCRELRQRILEGLAPVRPEINGHPQRTLPHILNLSFPGWDSQEVIDAWQDLAAISDGAACTTQARTCSHVLSAMALSSSRRDGAVRLSWSHLTPAPDLSSMLAALQRQRHA